MGLEEDKAQAAAGLADMFVQDAEGAPAGPSEPVAATPAGVEQPGVTAAAATPQEADEASEEEPEFPQFTYIDIDDEDDEDDPVAVTSGDAAEGEDFSEYGEDDIRARVTKAEKEAAFYREQALTAKRKEWRGKMEARYPLADFDDLTATSRRSYEKAAIRSHNANFKKLEPHVQKLQQAYAELKTGAKQEARQEAKDAWGDPVVGPGVPEIDHAAANAALENVRENARKTGDLASVFRHMIKLGK